jgi:hypothetical protein
MAEDHRLQLVLSRRFLDRAEGRSWLNLHIGRFDNVGVARFRKDASLCRGVTSQLLRVLTSGPL